MPKVKLLKNIPTIKLLSMIPPTLRAFVDINSIPEEKINLAIFAVDRRYVASSKDVAKVVSTTDDSIPLVVVGGSFTEEAVTLMKQVADYFVCSDESTWTDESYHRARQGKF